MFSFLKNFTDKIIAVLFAVLFCQFPAIYNQYFNVLSGALLEAQKTYDDIQKQAQENNLSLQEFIGRYLKNADEVFQGGGKVMQNSVERYINYRSAYQDFKDGSAIEKPYIFIKNFSSEIWGAMDYQASVPFNLEGLFYAILGILFCILILYLFQIIYQKIFPKPKAYKVPKPPKTKTKPRKDPTSNFLDRYN